MLRVVYTSATPDALGFHLTARWFGIDSVLFVSTRPCGSVRGYDAPNVHQVSATYPELVAPMHVKPSGKRVTLSPCDIHICARAQVGVVEVEVMVVATKRQGRGGTFARTLYPVM